MESANCLDYLRGDGHALAAAASTAPDSAIVSCPGWDMAQLVGHVGGVHRWAAAMVRSGTPERISRRDLPAAPTDPTARLAWFEEGLDEAIAVLRAAGPDAPAWNWQPGRARTAGFWPRRLAQETAVHRWDAQTAVGEPDPLDAALAVDGIDEYFELFLASEVATKPVDGLHGSLHLHATDIDGEWWVQLAPDHFERRHEHAKADAAIRGPASSLLLWLWNRLPADAADLQAFGDAEVMAQVSKSLTF
jgi:uncharacterized protein (TIGR03083 family)